MKTLLCGLLALVLAGCGSFRHRPSIKTAGVEVQAPADPEKPAQVDESRAVTTMPVPAGSTVEVRPSGDIVVTPKVPTEIRQVADHLVATTGTASVAIATRKAEMDKEAKVDGKKVVIGAGLIVLGVVIGWLLPGPMRWPIPGSMLSAVGLLIVLVPDPPLWAIAVPATLAAGGVLYFYVIKHQNSNA